MSPAARLVLLTFVLVVAVASAASALNYWAFGLARHPEDRLLRRIDGWRGRDIAALVLSDSVTAAAVDERAPLPGVELAVSNGWLRLAGQYFIAKRVLAHNDVASLYLFLTPELLRVDVNDEAGGRVRFTYTDTLFRRPEERALLAEAGDRGGGAFVLPSVLYRSWGATLKSEPRAGDRLTSMTPVPPPAEPLTRTQRAAIAARGEALRGSPVTPQNRFFLERLARLCAEHGTDCALVLAPMPRSLYARLANPVPPLPAGLRLIDINAHAPFPDEAFYDGTHLKEAWAAYYASFISARVVPLLAPLPAWTGDPDVIDARFDGRLRLEGFARAESWGRWATARTARIGFENALPPAAAYTVQLDLAAVVDPARGPQVARVSLNGHPLGELTIADGSGGRLSATVPADMLRPGLNWLELDAAYLTRADDGQERGVGVHAFGILPAA